MTPPHRPCADDETFVLLFRQNDLPPRLKIRLVDCRDGVDSLWPCAVRANVGGVHRPAPTGEHRPSAPDSTATLRSLAIGLRPLSIFQFVEFENRVGALLFDREVKFNGPLVCNGRVIIGSSIPRSKSEEDAIRQICRISVPILDFRTIPILPFTLVSSKEFCNCDEATDDPLGVTLMTNRPE
ncbi:unnamed protein product [Nesidiocoris tenuis]|uniref:Uncharacterized protein n=1 Tax=Nesidiocoris tenuis TaxID=355587 RepID=A0A6H5GDC9_9HEMI|nr:unnamed protein product [Nesidiocoris tenuis]